MIHPQTRLKVADNTGARTIQCIRVMGRSLKTDAGVGDVIIASVKQAIPNAAVKKGDVVRAVVVRLELGGQADDPLVQPVACQTLDGHDDRLVQDRKSVV